MKYLIILNPEAGKGRGKKLINDFKSLTDNSINYELILAEKQGDAKQIASEHSEISDIIIAVGGDGTAHEVLNGLGTDSKAIMGVLPIGSGNDFARSLHLNGTLEHNFDILFNKPKIKSIDSGIVKISDFGSREFTIHYFANSIGIGFDGLVAYLGQKNKYLKGIWLYLYSVGKAIFSFKNMFLEAKFDDRFVEGDKLLIAVGNGKTAGGGFLLNPDAEISDDKLNVCISKNLTKFRLLTLLPKAVFGKHKNEPEIELFEFRNAKIQLKSPQIVHSDGEILSTNAEEIEINIIPGKLKVITGI